MIVSTHKVETMTPSSISASYRVIALLVVLDLFSQLHVEAIQSVGVAAGTGLVQCSMSASQVAGLMWDNDYNSVTSSQYTLQLQQHVASDNTLDRSSQPLFRWLDPGVINARPTFQSFLALQDNYDPVSGHRDTPTSHEEAEVNVFLDQVMKTTVMGILLDYLQCRGLVGSGTELRATLHRMWFSGFPRRAHSADDTSGFEHVMVGEWKSSGEVNGLHHWLTYWSKERHGKINYYGYVKQAQPNLLAVNYAWGGHVKAFGSFFLGTSPEFDLALYTLAALTHTYSVTLGGRHVRVKVYDSNLKDGLQIATAYPDF